MNADRARAASPRVSRPGRLVLAGLVAGACLLAGGCRSLGSLGSLEPWVKPYERERLADPMMRFSRDAMSSKHFEHVREVREAGRGATGVQGGGCGCN